MSEYFCKTLTRGFDELVQKRATGYAWLKNSRCFVVVGGAPSSHLWCCILRDFGKCTKFWPCGHLALCLGTESRLSITYAPHHYEAKAIGGQIDFII